MNRAKPERLASISIDLDGLRNYEALHALPAASSADAVARLAPPRLAALLAERGAKGTFFAIGRELLPDGGPLRGLAADGHEIGNHTLDHDYALSRLDRPAIHRQIAGGAQAIFEAVGQRPVGFRAPGYTLSPEVLDCAAATGHRYDSSTFPAAPYYLIKAAVMGWLAARGRPSAAILDRPRVLGAPLLPYHPSPTEPYARGQHRLVELPLAIDPLSRLPFFGTFLVRAPWPLVRAVYASVRRQPFLNLELHGVDLLGPEDGVAEALAKAQGDLRVRAEVKLDRLRQVFGWLAQDYALVTLAEAAETF